jgi:ADP-heptose:LPS heptosyltransferase
LLAPFAGRPIVAVHASGGRAIKQWPVARFAEVAARVAREEKAVLLLTGTTGDRGIVDEVRRALPPGIEVLDLVGEVDLPVLAAMLSRCRLLITGDTGPMHLAAAVGTPIVAVFGPSMPWRYAPISAPHRIVRIDLPCAPCNRIRLPPVRCQGHTPDCLEGVTIDAVHHAARELLADVSAGNIA